MLSMISRFKLAGTLRVLKHHPFFFFFFFFFDFLFYLGVHSSVITCSPMKPRAGMYRTVLTVGMGFHCSYVAAHKQWKVAILILINTSAPIKFRIAEMETD